MSETEQKLREAALASALGVQIFKDAAEVVKDIIEMAGRDEIRWETAPCPQGAQAYQGMSKKYQILIIRARIIEEGGTTQYRGTAVGNPGAGAAGLRLNLSMMVLPPPTAEYLFTRAVAGRN